MHNLSVVFNPLGILCGHSGRALLFKTWLGHNALRKPSEMLLSDLLIVFNCVWDSKQPRTKSSFRRAFVPRVLNYSRVLLVLKGWSKLVLSITRIVKASVGSASC